MSGVRLDHAELNRLVRSPDGPAGRMLLRVGHRVEAAAKRRAPVNSGRLRDSITTRMVGVAPLRVEVGSWLGYAIHVHRGTGIYGPSGQRIRPRRASVLVFSPKGSARVVFARSVRGSRAQPFMTEALREVLGRG